MPELSQEEQWRRADEEVRKKLPPGVKLVRTLEGHRGAVRCVAFSPASRTLASGGEDGTVKLWDPATGRLLRTLEGHKAEVRSVAFNPASGTLASGSDDKTIKLWEAANGGAVAHARREPELSARGRL